MVTRRHATLAWSRIALALMLAANTSGPAAATPSPSLEPTAQQVIAELVARHGATERARIERGVGQVRRYWRPEDGDAAAFAAFARAEFVPTGSDLEATFQRFEFALERVFGYVTSLNRDLRRGLDLEIGPVLPLDRRLGAWDTGAHVADDLFATKLAFVGLLNFPLSNLQERLQAGRDWSRRQWAEARLAQRFAQRVPSAAAAATARAYSEADSYINDYNIHLHHVLDARGQRLFPPGLRLVSHWNLRDELKAQYAQPDGAARQRLIQQVMEAIVRQDIPQSVIDNPRLDWTPATGAVVLSPVQDMPAPVGRSAEPSREREPDTRYARWLAVFRAEREVDAHAPDTPTFLARRFEVDREIPEDEVQRLFEAVLASPLAPRVAALIQRRVGRTLEPFDLWYAGFKPQARHDEAQLDARTRSRYPSAEAFAADVPRILTELGFGAERARFLAEHIVVEPSRGPGHAAGATRRDDKAHLRTRVGSTGMDYKGYNIAVHELGHNVEQVFSVTAIDHTLLQGVPNNAFTEALAFVFQHRDLRLLGVAQQDPQARALRTLETFWNAREIAAVGLVDIAAWRWLYAHPDASPAEFRQAVVGIAQDVWNRHFATLLGARDVSLLAIYSHLVSYGLYTPDYGLGQLIAFQIEQHFERSQAPLGVEFERLALQGRLTPDAWMRQGVGAPLSAEPLLTATGEAVATLER